MTKEFPINDSWLYRDGFTPDCLEQSFDWTDSFIAQLPHNVGGDGSYVDDNDMRVVSTYSRLLMVPDACCGKRLLLSVEGALSYAEVYVNGIFVTSHEGEDPFVADITAPVKYSFENRIVIKVDSSAQSGGALLPQAGICRGVTFMVCDGRDIRDVCIRTKDNGETVTVTADVEMYDYYPGTDLEGDIVGPDGKVACQFIGRTVQAASVRIKCEAPPLEKWTPDRPTMYEAVVRLKQGKKTLDEKRVSFGFVTATFARDGFYLSGVRTPLIGINRADSYPVIGRAANAGLERRDARIIKSMGCNAVRTMGMCGRDFLDECNRIGLMVIEDIYGEGYIGDVQWRESFLSKLTGMVKRDRNHPCVIGWGIRVNDSPDCDELYFKAQKAVKEADPTRATVGARNFRNSRVYEDVFGYNETQTPSRRRSFKPFMPFIVSEHGGKNCPARTYDCSKIRVNHALSHMQAIDDVMGGKVAGAFGMSFCDFASPYAKGNGDNVSRYGVFDGHRNPKLAAYAYLSQTDDKPVMELSGNISEDDYDDRLYVFTNADSVVLYRNDERVGEFFPDRKTYKFAKHPPICISDFCGELPAEEVGGGKKLDIFKRVLVEAEQKGLSGLGFVGNLYAQLLRTFSKLDKDKLFELVKKYERTAEGVTYRLEGIYGGECKCTRVVSPRIEKELLAKCTSESVVRIDDSYERIAFTLRAEDGNGNVLDYCFMPVTVSASGSLAVEGSRQIGLEGGRGGFFVRSVSPGPGRVAISSHLGELTFDFYCESKQISEFDKY